MLDAVDAMFRHCRTGIPFSLETLKFISHPSISSVLPGESKDSGGFVDQSMLWFDDISLTTRKGMTH